MRINLTKVERKWLVGLIDYTMPKIKIVNHIPTDNSVKEIQSRVRVIDKLNGAVWR